MAFSHESHLRDSNPGPQLYESCALPTELRWHDREAPRSQREWTDLTLRNGTKECQGEDGDGQWWIALGLTFEMPVIVDDEADHRGPAAIAFR